MFFRKRLPVFRKNDSGQPVSAAAGFSISPVGRVSVFCLGTKTRRRKGGVLPNGLSYCHYMKLFQKISAKTTDFLFRLPAPVIVAAIWILSSQSTLPQIKTVLGIDKIQHLLAYTVLAVAAGFWISPETWGRRKLGSFLLTAAVASIYGAVDEIHQFFVPGRNADVWDWAADTLGGLLGALAALSFVPWGRRKKD
jgi:VanZ family protein